LPALDGGEAIVATLSLKGYDTRRVPSAQVAGLDVRDPILILPGQLVRFFETELPKAARKQQRQMARFAREDDIAASAETIHFALSSEQPPKLAVIDKSVMESLIETLGQLKPKAAYADYDLLSGDSAIRVLDRAVEPGVAALDLDWTEEVLTEPSDAALSAQFAEGIAKLRQITWNLRASVHRPIRAGPLPSRFKRVQLKRLVFWIYRMFYLQVFRTWKMSAWISSGLMRKKVAYACVSSIQISMRLAASKRRLNKLAAL